MRKGFTLIELIVSLCLLTIIATAFSGFFQAGISRLADTQEFARALNSSQAQMEALRAKSFDALKDTSFENGRGNIRVRPVTHNLVEIRLTLDWKEGRKPLEFISMRAK